MRSVEDSLVGQVLGGEFEIRALLARGGQAVVYRAYSRDRDAEVAVKVLSPSLSADPEFRQRFLDEFRSLAQLHHENLVEVYRYGVENGLVYIAMRMVSGGTLSDRLSVLDGPVDLITTSRIISQVSSALQHAHDHGLIHLDIKPSNILLGRADWPLLADFGITRAMETEHTDRGAVRIAGTPLFMSPEQCSGGPLDGRSDQYSLAVATFEMLTGQLPFQATTTEQLLDDHRHTPPPRPRSVNPGIPAPVEDVLLRAMSKDPNDRYPTIQGFGDALRLAVAQTHGVSLETKAALAGLAPTLVAFLGLIVLAPVLLASLPDTPLFGSVSLTWPFSVLMSILLVGGLLRARWYFVGLLARGIGGLADIGRPNPTIATAAELDRWSRWRKRLIGSAEGIVNLGYVFAVYQLVLAPVAQISRSLVPGGDAALVGAVAVALALLVTLVILVGMSRTAGPFAVVGLVVVVAAFVLSALPGQAVLLGASPTLAVVQVLAGLVLIAGWLPIRRGGQALLGGVALRVVAQGGDVRAPEFRDRLKQRTERAIGNAIDLVLAVILLIILLHGLTAVAGRLPIPTYVYPAVALFIWLVLALRLAAGNGWSWLALAVLVALPLFATAAIALPATGGIVALGGAPPRIVVVWATAGTAALLLLLLRSSFEGGARPVGAWAERQLIGPVEAPSEEDGDRRKSALAGLIRSLGDIALIVVAFWLVGPPLVATLNAGNGSPWILSSILIGLTAVIAAILLVSLGRTRSVLVSTGAMDWARGGAMPFLAIGSAAIIVSGGAAVPAVIANPEIAHLGVQLETSVAPHLIISWQFWQPQTPSNGEATYNLAISCSNGDRFGEFREAFKPPSGGMPKGAVVPPVLATTGCADWKSLYFALRQAAGVTAPSSLSWNWLDENITLHPDGSADVVDTQRVSFTSGSFNGLQWNIPDAPGQKVSNVKLRDGALVYVFDPAVPTDRSAHLVVQGDDPLLTWTFPTIVSPAEHTYTISYHLAGATHAAGTGAIFQRQIVPPRESGPVWRTTVEVAIPTTVPTGGISLDSTGSPTRHDLIDGHTAWYEGTDLSTANSLTVLINLSGGMTGLSSSSGAAGSQASSTGPTGSSSVTPTTSPTPTSTPTIAETATAAAGLTATAGAGSDLTATASADAEITATAAASAATTATAAATASATPTVTATLTASPSTTPANATPSTTPTNTQVAAAATPSPTATSRPVVAGACGKAPILAMYYDWYDMNSWNSTLSDQPAAPYLSADRATIERQVTQAQSVGIDGFEVNWNGPNNPTDTNLQTLLSVAQAHNFKVTVDVDLNSPLMTNPTQIAAALSYLTKYYNNPAWFHFNGKPFVVFFGVKRYPVSTWAAIRAQVDPNSQVFWMGEGDVFSYLNAFDGIHPYSIAWSPNPASPLASYARQTRAVAGKVWMATAMPGYNDVGVNGANGYVRDRANGAYYQSSWAGAVATNPDIINITSFNEWTEGSYIEPSQKYGSQYLDLTKQLISGYRAGQGC